MPGFEHIYDGVCFRCNGSGIDPDYIAPADAVGCPMDVAAWYPEDNCYMPERCDAPTIGRDATGARRSRARSAGV